MVPDENHGEVSEEFAPVGAEFHMQGAVRTIYQAHTAENLASVAQGASGLRDIAAKIMGLSGGAASVIEETVTQQEDGKYYMRVVVDFLTWTDFMATNLRLIGASPTQVFPPDQVLMVFPEPNADYMLDLRLLLVTMLHAINMTGRSFVVHFRTPLTTMSIGLTFKGRPNQSEDGNLEVVNLDPTMGDDGDDSEG